VSATHWAEPAGLMDYLVGGNFLRKSKKEPISDLLMGVLKRRGWLSTLSYREPGR
jgi:hypothetical protein